MPINSLIKGILFFLFPPESPVVQFLRTQYHRLVANKFYVALQLKDSKASYSQWLKLQQIKSCAKMYSISAEPGVLFLLQKRGPNQIAYCDLNRLKFLECLPKIKSFIFSMSFMPLSISLTLKRNKRNDQTHHSNPML
jgi:hypothetical protein